MRGIAKVTINDWQEIAHALSIGKKPWMTLNCYKFKFSRNFAWCLNDERSLAAHTRLAHKIHVVSSREGWHVVRASPAVNRLVSQSTEVLGTPYLTVVYNSHTTVVTARLTGQYRFHVRDLSIIAGFPGFRQHCTCTMYIRVALINLKTSSTLQKNLAVNFFESAVSPLLQHFW